MITLQHTHTFLSISNLAIVAVTVWMRLPAQTLNQSLIVPAFQGVCRPVMLCTIVRELLYWGLVQQWEQKGEKPPNWFKWKVWHWNPFLFCVVFNLCIYFKPMMIFLFFFFKKITFAYFLQDSLWFFTFGNASHCVRTVDKYGSTERCRKERIWV